MRIRSEHIAYFLIISIVPLSAVVYVSYEYSQNAIRDSVNTNLLAATENSGRSIDSWMDARKDDISIISAIIEIGEKEKLQQNLGAFQKEHDGVYEEFFIIGHDGNVIFSTSSAGIKSYHKEAPRDELFVSDVSLSDVTGQPEMIITNPVKKNGTITGILGARISMENLYTLIEGIDVGKSGEIFIVNNRGELVFHKNRTKILNEKIDNNFAVKEVTYEKRGMGDYINYTGEKVIGSYYWMPL
ncbi:MAG TPA: cache domain-containing protein, partial [Candidatus Methanoperedens sp.]